ncbi:AI-2E family transporter [Zophobihabitans entericus]|uniref:AI-2E family transporter n=1 Tax=Zophobihabitans entericus TaxID=1635327 RepID=A0A6G9ICK7_9GAMM|nr:AI-2E family transporter [Zophobihabitans entericus]QIQ21966.1 AI-2E family transporter [Zophobihabitans entericus]
MFKMFMNWYQRRFSDPHAVSLVTVLLLFFLIIYFFHSILTPILIAIALAYILEKPVNFLVRRGVSRILAIVTMMCFFIAIVLIGVAILLPLIWQQGVSLVTNLPVMLNALNRYVMTLPELYPELLDAGLFDALIESIRSKMLQTGNSLVQFSIASLFSLVSIIINAVLVPMIMFFLLKDKKLIFEFCGKLLPKNRTTINQVAEEMDQQISNYINGKVLEIIILTVATYIPFWFLKLDYALLLAVIVGLSVIIPYIGIVIASIPVILIALFQWGVSLEFLYLMICYFIVQTLDGNVVTPILFSEVLNLHPLVVILAVVIFGGLWGFWGVFFAIPLATLVKAVIHAWPSSSSGKSKTVATQE